MFEKIVRIVVLFAMIGVLIRPIIDAPPAMAAPIRQDLVTAESELKERFLWQERLSTHQKEKEAVILGADDKAYLTPLPQISETQGLTRTWVEGPRPPVDSPVTPAPNGQIGATDVVTGAIKVYLPMLFKPAKPEPPAAQIPAGVVLKYGGMLLGDLEMNVSAVYNETDSSAANYLDLLAASLYGVYDYTNWDFDTSGDYYDQPQVIPDTDWSYRDGASWDPQGIMPGDDPDSGSAKLDPDEYVTMTFWQVGSSSNVSYLSTAVYNLGNWGEHACLNFAIVQNEHYYFDLPEVILPKGLAIPDGDHLPAALQAWDWDENQGMWLSPEGWVDNRVTRLTEADWAPLRDIEVQEAYILPELGFPAPNDPTSPITVFAYNCGDTVLRVDGLRGEVETWFPTSQFGVGFGYRNGGDFCFFGNAEDCQDLSQIAFLKPPYPTTENHFRAIHEDDLTGVGVGDEYSCEGNDCLVVAQIGETMIILVLIKIAVEATLLGGAIWLHYEIANAEGGQTNIAVQATNPTRPSAWTPEYAQSQYDKMYEINAPGFPLANGPVTMRMTNGMYGSFFNSAVAYQFIAGDSILGENDPEYGPAVQPSDDFYKLWAAQNAPIINEANMLMAKLGLASTLSWTTRPNSEVGNNLPPRQPCGGANFFDPTGHDVKWQTSLQMFNWGTEALPEIRPIVRANLFVDSKYIGNFEFVAFPSSWLAAVDIQPQYRGMGYGTFIMQRYHWITAKVLQENGQTIHLMKKHTFTDVNNYRYSCLQQYLLKLFEDNLIKIEPGNVINFFNILK